MLWANTRTSHGSKKIVHRKHKQKESRHMQKGMKKDKDMKPEASIKND